MTARTRIEWIYEIFAEWQGLEDCQLADGDTVESLAQRRYLVVEHGRDAERRWFHPFNHPEDALDFAASRAVEDEWGFTAAYDLDTGEELKIEFCGRIAERKPIDEQVEPCSVNSGAERHKPIRTDGSVQIAGYVPNIPTPSASHVTVRAPTQAWNLLWETLELDARSSAFEAPLRRDIAQAMAKVECVGGPHQTRQTQGKDGDET